MKIYFYLLAVLFASSTATRLLSLAMESDPLFSLKIIADVVLFAVCLLACHGLAFRRRYFSPAFWAWPGHLTLIMGGGHILLILSRLEETASPFWPIDLGMAAVIYGLFAIPAVLYANELKIDPELKSQVEPSSKT